MFELIVEFFPVLLVIIVCTCNESEFLQVCKRRTKAVNTKSPGTVTSKNAQKSYKHLDLWPFSSIKRVVDICETESMHCPHYLRNSMFKKEFYQLVDEKNWFVSVGRLILWWEICVKVFVVSSIPLKIHTYIYIFFDLCIKYILPLNPINDVVLLHVVHTNEL